MTARGLPDAISDTTNDTHNTAAQMKISFFMTSRYIHLELPALPFRHPA